MQPFGCLSRCRALGSPGFLDANRANHERIRSSVSRIFVNRGRNNRTLGLRLTGRMPSVGFAPKFALFACPKLTKTGQAQSHSYQSAEPAALVMPHLDTSSAPSSSTLQ